MEDLNQLYSRQQIALIRAAATPDSVHRRRHAQIASDYGKRIAKFRGARIRRCNAT